VAELHTVRIAAVFAANSHLQLGTRLPALLDAPANQHAHALLIQGLKRIAREHAPEIEQPAQRAVERIVEVVRGIERCVGRVVDPRLQFQALEHAVAGEAALGVVEPQHDRDQEGAAAQHEQREIGEITA